MLQDARRLIPRLHDTTGCQTELHNRSDNRVCTRYSRLSNRLSIRFDNGLTTGCIVYTNIYPVVKTV